VNKFEEIPYHIIQVFLDDKSIVMIIIDYI